MRGSGGKRRRTDTRKGGKKHQQKRESYAGKTKEGARRKQTQPTSMPSVMMRWQQGLEQSGATIALYRTTAVNWPTPTLQMRTLVRVFGMVDQPFFGGERLSDTQCTDVQLFKNVFAGVTQHDSGHVTFVHFDDKVASSYVNELCDAFSCRPAFLGGEKYLWGFGVGAMARPVTKDDWHEPLTIDEKKRMGIATAGVVLDGVGRPDRRVDTLFHELLDYGVQVTRCCGSGRCMTLLVSDGEDARRLVAAGTIRVGNSKTVRVRLLTVKEAASVCTATPNVRPCGRCCSAHHGTPQCKSKPRCRYCGLEGHKEMECVTKKAGEHACCRNCGGTHVAGSPMCPIQHAPRVPRLVSAKPGVPVHTMEDEDDADTAAAEPGGDELRFDDVFHEDGAASSMDVESADDSDVEVQFDDGASAAVEHELDRSAGQGRRRGAQPKGPFAFRESGGLKRGVDAVSASDDTSFGGETKRRKHGATEHQDADEDHMF